MTYEKPTNQRGRDSRPLLIFVGANMSDVVIVALITGGLTLLLCTERSGILKVAVWPRRIVIFLIAANFMCAGCLITKAFDCALTGQIWDAGVAVFLSGLNVTAGRILIDLLGEDEVT